MPYIEHELPYFSLRQNDLPEILTWEVGGEYYVLMKVEMTALRERADLDSKLDKTMREGDFKVKSIKTIGKEPLDLKSIEKADFDNLVADVKSGRV